MLPCCRVATKFVLSSCTTTARTFRHRSQWFEFLAQCRTSSDSESDSAKVVGVGFVVFAVTEAIACKHLLLYDKPELEALYGSDGGVQDVDEIFAVSESIEWLLRGPSKAHGIGNRGADSQQFLQVYDCQLRSVCGLAVNDEVPDHLGGRHESPIVRKSTRSCVSPDVCSIIRSRKHIAA